MFQDSNSDPLLPAGTTTAPAGAVDGPESNAVLPQMSAGGDDGAPVTTAAFLASTSRRVIDVTGMETITATATKTARIGAGRLDRSCNSRSKKRPRSAKTFMFDGLPICLRG